MSTLPPLCHARHPEDGYHPVETDLTPEQLNSVLREVPTALQADAVLMGCMFGWHVPRADPDKLRERHRSLS